MKGSLIIVGFFVLGTICGVCHLLPFDIAETNISYYALCALMFSVGLSVGNDPQTLKNFRSLNPRLVFLPIMTILGTLAGSAAVFGVIAGAVMYGVYYTGSTILPVKSSSDYNNIATVTSNVTATTAQSTSSASTGMDAQSVANAALPAMVALNGTTTVSSGSSSSFYGLFGSQSY